jgi:hypothetical protein
MEQACYISRRMWLVGIMHPTWVCPGSIPSPAVPIRPCIVAVLGPADRSLAMALPTPLFSAYVYCIDNWSVPLTRERRATIASPRSQPRWVQYKGPCPCRRPRHQRVRSKRAVPLGAHRYPGGHVAGIEDCGGGGAICTRDGRKLRPSWACRLAAASRPASSLSKARKTLGQPLSAAATLSIPWVPRAAQAG